MTRMAPGPLPSHHRRISISMCLCASKFPVLRRMLPPLRMSDRPWYRRHPDRPIYWKAHSHLSLSDSLSSVKYSLKIKWQALTREQRRRRRRPEAAHGRYPIAHVKCGRKQVLCQFRSRGSKSRHRLTQKLGNSMRAGYCPKYPCKICLQCMENFFPARKRSQHTSELIRH
jgi:hypothetical protein